MILLVSLLFLAVNTATAGRYFISAPNVFHVGVPENVSVVVSGQNAPVTVQVYLQDYPHRKKIFSQIQADFTSDSPGTLTVKVNPSDVPDQGSLDKQYVYLVASSPQLKFKQESKILLSFRNGIILIQTDKPIYTPKQTVNIRVVPLDFNLYPSTRNLTVIVKNPQGVRVQQWKNLRTGTGFISKAIDLGHYAMKGNWTVEAYYDRLFVHNTSTVFEVKEYVLPRFSVKIKGPDFILRTTDEVNIFITAQYTYGKSVFGYGRVRVQIVGFNQQPIQIALFSKEVKKSVLTFKIKMKDISNAYRRIWFPEGYRLQIEAAITERSTGITERAMENAILFTSSPYKIKVVNTAKYFRPGLQFPIKVHLTTINNKPQHNMPMRITAVATNIGGKDTQIDQSVLRSKDDAANKGITDRDGYADFLIDTPRDAEKIRIKVETNLPNKAHNGAKDYIVNKYLSESQEYLMVRQRKPAQVGQNVFCEAFISDKTIKRLAYMVIARGQIVYQNVLVGNFGFIKTIIFQATSMMSPSSRLVAYYTRSDGEVVSDVTTLDITDSLPNTISIVDSKAVHEEHPGLDYTVRVLGEKGTRIGLLAVDQSVYLLRNKNRLTPKSVFDKLDELDLGCGASGGKNTEDVFKNSGLSVIAGQFISKPRPDFTCHEAPSKRKKRSIGPDPKAECCRLGNTTDSRPCMKRMQDLEVPAFEYDRAKCAVAFLKCCIARNGAKDMGLLARSGGDVLGLIGDDFAMTPDQIVDMAQVRSYFPETWLFEERVISDQEDAALCNQYLGRPSCHATSLTATVPHTISTFIVQAIAVSNQSGFGIAKPLNLRIYKDVFMTLKMPYSAQRGEQISILATVYNYRSDDIRVNFYLTTNEGFCSMAAIGQSTTPLNKNKLLVRGKGGTASFPITIVPIKYGTVPVRVYMNYGINPEAVERKLLVVPEGIEKQKTQTFILDPQSVLKDSKQINEKNDVKGRNTTFKTNQILDRNQNTQIDNVFIDVPKDSIPESVSAKISFTGNLIGPVVTNLITGGLEALLRMPTGCGEQTMIYMSPNVYALQYLSNTNQVTDVIEGKAYNFIKSGYTRELNYRRDDHSYSAWGNSRPGSTWLTAFVVKVFCEASKFDSISDHIDENAICQSVSWILRNQRADGAIPEVHHVIHKEMVGGVYQNGDIAITAFIVTALLECKCNSLVTTSAISNAVAYLEKNLDNMKDPYTIAISTYALALANSPQKHKANDKLTEKAIYDSATVSRHWNAGGHALNIETAAYALLAQMVMNRLKYGGPIVTWLTEQRNSGGGFKSTTDTCVALQALAKYSEQTAGAKLDLKITIAPNNVPKGVQKPRPLLITKDNALLQQTVDIYPYLRQEGGDFVINTVGTGVAQMQIDLKYNLAVSKEAKCAFIIEHSITKIGLPIELSQNDQPAATPKPKRKKKRKGKAKRKGKRKGKGKKKNRKNRKNKKNRKNRKNRKDKGNKNKSNKRQKTQTPPEMVINVCAKYKKPGKTGMAIVDVGVLTGYEVDEQSVMELMKKMNDTIANYEISERSVVFYLDSIDNVNKICLGVKIKRVFDMGAVYPVPIKVYDYYEPDDKCTAYYNLGKGATIIGSCSDDGSSCKCTQDKCAALNPSISDHDKMMQRICNEYDYAITGKVIFVDEKDSWLTYAVKVDEILMQGNKNIKLVGFTEFWKRTNCLNPDLKKGNKVLILGRDKAGRYIIDNSSLVADITGSAHIIASLKTRIDNGECRNI
uniref:Complement component C3 n=1 Tax=Diadumene lineata TaxID=1789172 RepID=D4Q9Z9_9CNID|nr:complement component C3 precursor [Diadumene lineata]